MPQLEHIEAIERRLWGAADTLRANSNYASNEYFLPVMGLVFLRHAFSRYLAVKDGIETNLPTRGGKKRALTKEDFSQKSAIFLRPEAQFDHLVALPDSEDRAKAIIAAMDSIEADYDNLRGVLPKSEYQELDNDVLGQLLRTLNPDELKQVSGDVFGRIYEYFLTQFADQKAHDGGEFFTPVSLVSLIAHVLDPERGTVLDPACGSGGMFVQSARTVEEHGQSPTEQLTFRGLEKNATTIRLAKMNLAVHGLEGDIQQAITYYEDPHELVGKADYVMANPPFNVDEIDADKVKTDPRLPFGLPGVNKKDKVSNGNYIWISYFYSYLSKRGRAGFVMSSQASSAGRDEAKVRQKLVETGDVDLMIAIRSNFFYTRTVPCELWFLNRDKAEAHRDKVLMLDARNVYRKVTRKIYDFSPEQQRNLLTIVRLYRGETDRFLELVSEYLGQVADEGGACFEQETEEGETTRPLPDYAEAVAALTGAMQPFLDTLPPDGPHAETLAEFNEAWQVFAGDVEQFRDAVTQAATRWEKTPDTNTGLNKLTGQFAPLAESSRDLVRQTDLIYKLAARLIETCEKECDAKSNDAWNGRDITRARKAADEARKLAVEQLKQVRYFWRQAHWLTERFPEAKLRDVEGLVKLVDRAEIEANDWSLTPGRYVGVAPEEEDEDFDFEETLREIHVELEDLNAEAATLAATIKKNFEELGGVSHIPRTRPGWRPAALQDLVFFQRGYDITKAEQKPGDIPVVSSSGINSYHAEAKVDGPGVVIGRKGSLGTVHYVDGPFWPHDTTLWSKDLRGNCARYVYYFLHTLGLERYDVGNANPTLNRNHIHGLDIEIPEHPVQMRIAGVLSAYDDLIENNRRRIQLLEQAARLLYKEWFVHLRFPGHEHVTITDGVPEGWERKDLGDIAETNEENYKAGSLPDEINYIDISSVSRGRITGKSTMPSTEAPGRARRKARSGDVIWSNVRPNLRAYALVLDPGDCDVFSTGFTVLSPNTVPFSFFYLFVTTDEFVGHLVNHATGVSYPAVRPDDFDQAAVLLPSSRVLELFHESTEPMFRLMSVLEEEVSPLVEARDLLLPRLMNGEVSV